MLQATPTCNRETISTTPIKNPTPDKISVLGCDVDDCPRKVLCKDLCAFHYRRKRSVTSREQNRSRYVKLHQKDPKWIAFQLRKNDPDNFLRKRFAMAIYECKSRKRNNFEWRLTFDEFKVFCSQPCTYCDGVLGQVKFGKGLDRIDTNGHYEKDNVLPCCRTCNRIRGDDITVDEARSMINHLLELRR